LLYVFNLALGSGLQEKQFFILLQIKSFSLAEEQLLLAGSGTMRWSKAEKNSDN